MDQKQLDAELRVIAKLRATIDEAIRDKNWVALHGATKELQRVAFRIYMATDGQ